MRQKQWEEGIERLLVAAAIKTSQKLEITFSSRGRQVGHAMFTTRLQEALVQSLEAAIKRDPAVILWSSKKNKWPSMRATASHWSTERRALLLCYGEREQELREIAMAADTDEAATQAIMTATGLAEIDAFGVVWRLSATGQERKKLKEQERQKLKEQERKQPKKEEQVDLFTLVGTVRMTERTGLDLVALLQSMQPLLAEVKPLLAEVKPLLAEVKPLLAEVKPLLAEVKLLLAEVKKLLVDVTRTP